MKSFNFLEFKRSILNTLLQAVKAIKGGVIALGGQIIKAKGQIISTAGNIVATKGDAISSFGRHIATSALLSPQPHQGATAFAHAHVGDGPYPSAHHSDSYGPPSYDSSVSLSGYGEPTADHGYNKRGATALPETQELSSTHAIPSGVQPGLLVLKPIDQQQQFLDPRGVKTFHSRRSVSHFKRLPVVQDANPDHVFGAREVRASASETRPFVIDNIQHANARSYFINYSQP